jgi:perosamine synthetase
MNRLMTNKYLILPTLDESTRVSWFVFVVRLNDLFEPGDRDKVMQELRAAGIGCNNYFPPIHLQPYMQQQFGFEAGAFPITEYIASRTLALPFFAKMNHAQIGQVCQILESTLEKVLIGRKGHL